MSLLWTLNISILCVCVSITCQYAIEFSCVFVLYFFCIQSHATVICPLYLNWAAQIVITISFCFPIFFIIFILSIVNQPKWLWTNQTVKSSRTQLKNEFRFLSLSTCNCAHMFKSLSFQVIVNQLWIEIHLIKKN